MYKLVFWLHYLENCNLVLHGFKLIVFSLINQSICNEMFDRNTIKKKCLRFN